MNKKIISGDDWEYTDYQDLLSWHIEVTRQSYDLHSGEYAESWEWNERVRDMTSKAYMGPFMKYVKKGGVVLVVGCGTGRDLETLSNNGYRYLGIDSSFGMLGEAVNRREARGPLLNLAIEEAKLIEGSFDGVLIDSALEHVKKIKVPLILGKIFKSLRKGGVCLLRFRLGTGNVFVTKDEVGERYFCTYMVDDMEKVIGNTGFALVDKYESNHLNNSRPSFFTYILRK